MYFAALGDVNGNARALRAVLDDVADQGILTVLQTGNVVLGRGEARQVLALLRERRVTYVQGVKDRAVLRFRRKEAQLRNRHAGASVEFLAAAYEALSGESIESLRRLPARLELVIEDLSILLCHGSVSNPSDVLDGETSLMKLERQREAAPVDIVVCGGAPAPFARRVQDTLFVGPGWVDHAPGLARYSIVDTEQAPWVVEMKQIRFEKEEGTTA